MQQITKIRHCIELAARIGGWSRQHYGDRCQLVMTSGTVDDRHTASIGAPTINTCAVLIDHISSFILPCTSYMYTHFCCFLFWQFCHMSIDKVWLLTAIISK